MMLTNATHDAESDTETGASTTIYVCITCRRPGDPDNARRTAGADLARATARAAEGADIAVREISCLANCKRGLSAAIRHQGAWTYVFGDLDPAKDGGALVEGARLLARSSDGLMPWDGRPKPLKRGLIARVPPVDFRED